MRQTENALDVLRLICVATLGALGLVACGGPTTRHWTEDVLLDDGSTVVVERSVAFNETSAWGGGAYNAVETEATLAFTGDLAGLPVWSAPLMALLLYRDQTRGGQWVIVATTTSCQVWNLRGEPPSMYWEYRLGPQGWQEVMLSPTSIGRKANLLHRYQQKLGTRHITAADRQTRESDTRIAKTYKEILAVPEFPCTPAAKELTGASGRDSDNH